MKSIRNLLGDLVERRLWPVALLLVVAAVAVPVYLGRSSSDDGATDVAAPGATAQAGVKASKAAVSLDESADGSDGVGRTHDPFKQKHVPKVKKADTGTDKASGSSGGASPSTDSGSGSSGGTAPSTGGDTGSDDTGSGDTGTDDDAAKKDVDVSHVSLHLGPIGQLTTYKDVARLSPLPSAGNPLFVFTGVLEHSKTVVLLPASTVQISEESDVECEPSNKSCQRLELSEDDTVFFTIAGDATGTQYQLDIISVRLTSGGSAKATAAALKRHSNAGAAALRDAHVYNSADFKGASAYRWMPETGLLTRVPKHAHASANGATAASADDAAAALPGLPVWHFEDDA
jgi:hypothetical protein